MNLSGQSQPPQVGQAIEITIRLGIIILITFWCFQILSPFISMILWGAIIAVAIYSPFLTLAEKLGGRKKPAVIIIAIAGIALVVLPVVSLTGSLVDGATSLGTAISSGTLKIPPPSENVQSWPLVGGKVYAFWHQASVDLSALIENNQSQLVGFGKSLLGMAAGAGIGALQMIISILIAAAFLSNAEAAGGAMKKLARRLNGEQGEKLITLSVFTIRSVAGGLLGIAIFQALLAGIGMAVIDVPAAGLLALGVLMLCIAQVPPILLLGPVAFYVFSVESSTVATVFLVWCLIVNFADLVLKPVFLGRGVDAPMLVILLGAVGGMLASGIVGLFVGAVVLALGYKLFDAWLQKEVALPGQDRATDTQSVHPD